MYKETQQFGRRNTCTPWGSVSAPGSVAGGLNSSERVGAVLSGLKTLPNNPEGQELRRGEQGLRVPVLNMRGEPLMPTTPRKARKLLEENKAKVVQRNPFTIQLKYPTGEAKQDITMGIDAGYSKIGFSAVTNKEELIAGELELRNDIKRLLEKRRVYRRERRCRKWYRKVRFDNRKRKEGWLPPSLQHKLDSHIKLIERLKKILPITKVIVETALFDTQKIQNLEIKGVEYQRGELFGYEVREYLLEKWQRKCAFCGKSDIPLEIDHIIPKAKGGSDRVSNLCICCRGCNQKKGNQTAKEFGYPNVRKQAKETLKTTAFMNAIRWRLVNMLNCAWTYGSITKYKRRKLDLEKSHINDAFVIAGGESQIRRELVYKGKQVRRHKRSFFKINFLKGGRKRRNTVKQVNGFHRFDKVIFNGIRCFVYGLRSSGYFELRDMEGNKMAKAANSKKLKLIERAKGEIWEVKRAIPPRAEARGEISLPMYDE